MSEYELTSLVYDLFRDMDAQIEFWMQATFAVVVAVYFAGHRLSLGFRRFLSVIYLAASLQSALRWVLYLRRVLAHRQEMVDLGYSDIPTTWWLVGSVTTLLAVVFIGGVIGTAYFLARKDSWERGEAATE
jgi:hypothetical protein